MSVAASLELKLDLAAATDVVTVVAAVAGITTTGAATGVHGIRHRDHLLSVIHLTIASRAPNVKGRSESDQTAQVHSGVHVGIALVDVLEGVLAGDQFIELQLSGAVEFEQPRDVAAGTG